MPGEAWIDCISGIYPTKIDCRRLGVTDSLYIIISEAKFDELVKSPIFDNLLKFIDFNAFFA